MYDIIMNLLNNCIYVLHTLCHRKGMHGTAVATLLCTKHIF